MTGDTRSLRDLLQLERACLREGRYDALADIAAQKERQLTLLMQRPAAAAEMADLKAMIAGNMRLIHAARDGFAAAREGTAAVRRTAAGFSSYGADGRSAEIAAAPRPHVERRA